MATRIALQDQHQGGGVKHKNFPGGNSNNNRRSRTALGDIGNLVKVPTVQGKPINRPITRNFGAKLLANAQVAADKSKKQGERVADLGPVANHKPRKEGAAVVTKAAGVLVGQKKLQPCTKAVKATVGGPSENNGRAVVAKEDGYKRKCPTFTSVLAARSKKQGERVADLGPVANHKPRKEGAARVVGQKKLQPCSKAVKATVGGPSESNGKVVVAKEDGSKKKRPTFTPFLVLAARTMEALGVPKKVIKEQIVNVYEGDINNELAVVEYVEDISQFCKLSEPVLQAFRDISQFYMLSEDESRLPNHKPRKEGADVVTKAAVVVGQKKLQSCSKAVKATVGGSSENNGSAVIAKEDGSQRKGSALALASENNGRAVIAKEDGSPRTCSVLARALALREEAFELLKKAKKEMEKRRARAERIKIINQFYEDYMSNCKPMRIMAKAVKATVGSPSENNERAVVAKEDGSNRKDLTFSSGLAARSKESCGVPKMVKGQIVNIDEGDINNELAVVEYVEDINQFYKLSEDESRLQDYMSKQPDINERMRSNLVDWMIEYHYNFELMPETLYLTINIVDRFLSVKTVPCKELKLVGISSLLIASKYEEICPMGVNDVVFISDRAYTNTQVLAMEKAILGKLGWELTVSTPYMFLPRYIKASSDSSDVEMEHMVFFYAELGLMNYSTMMSFCPSMLAASSVYAARCTLNKTTLWTETLKHYTGYSENQLKECAKVLLELHSLALTTRAVVYRKYAMSDFEFVAHKAPAKILLA